MWGNIIPIHSVLRKKATKLNSQPTQYKKLKSIKIILKINKKNHKKKHVWKHYSNPQCFKEKNYKAKFLTSSILKK
jgi:hypothetical protein